ncbi:MAG: hypothetical protein WEA76_04910 [Acidimicrobiia bacterium]
MDTTSHTPISHTAIARVTELLAAVAQADPADTVEPMTEIAEMLEKMLDQGDDA